MPKVQVEVEDSGLKLMQAVAGLVKAAKGGGVSALLPAALADVVAVVGEIEALPADLKEDLGELIEGALVGAVQVVQAAIA